MNIRILLSVLVLTHLFFDCLIMNQVSNYCLIIVDKT